MIRGIWTVSPGCRSRLRLERRLVQYVPGSCREYRSQLLPRTGQDACISCHGGGLTALNHGYSTVGDLWDSTPPTACLLRDPHDRHPEVARLRPQEALRQRDVQPDAEADAGVQPGQLRNRSQPGLDLSITWGRAGSSTSWAGAPEERPGLAALGAALGQATSVYQNSPGARSRDLPHRHVQPDGHRPDRGSRQGADDIRVIVAQVASSSTCI